MSSPTNPDAESNGQHQPPSHRNDFDIDAEMEDSNTKLDDPTTSSGQNASSATLDHEMGSTQQQQDHNGSGTTTTLPAQSRKDVTLREFLSKMDDYAPIIPDAVTAHYLTLAGLPPPSPHDPTGATTGTTPLSLARLLALATQKFVADIAADAYQYSRIRASNTAAGNNPLGAVGGMPGQAGALSMMGGGVGAGGGGGVGATGGAKGGAGAQALGVQRSGYGGGGQGGSGQGKTVLTMEDLGMAVQEYGINVKRGEFYR